MPLFPHDPQELKIKPGQNYDQYLFVALHEVIKNPEIYSRFKSLFTENEDGTITVRIRYQKERLSSRYNKREFDYQYNKEADEEVFTITKEKIAELKQCMTGIDTDSLPIKIIERISKYYYYDTCKVPGMPQQWTYKLDLKFCTPLVGNLFDLYPLNHLYIKQVVRLKKVCPHLPVYLSIHETSDLDTYTLDSIDNSGADLNFLLSGKVSDTKKMYSEGTINQRKGQWYAFAPTLAAYHFIFWLMQIDNEQYDSLINTPGQINLMQDVLQLSPESGRYLLDSLHQYIKNAPSILLYYNFLQAPQREFFCEHLLTQLPMENAQQKNPDLQANLAFYFQLEQPFWDMIIQQAIKEKENTGMSFAEARNYVHSSLINYYFSQDLQAVTQAGSLRHLISLFTPDMILNTCASKKFNFKLICAILKGKYLNEREKSLACEPIALDDEECKEILTARPHKISDLFVKLYYFCQYNPEIAAQLTRYALDHMQELYNLPREEVIQQLQKLRTEGFRSWLEEIVKSQSQSLSIDLGDFFTKAIKNNYLRTYQYSRTNMSDGDVLSFLKNHPELGSSLMALELQKQPVNQQLLWDMNRQLNPQRDYLDINLLKIAVERAVLDKKITDSIDIQEAQDYINSILVGYLYEQNIMTRSGGLRGFFDDKSKVLFCRSQLWEITTTEDRDFYTVSHFFEESFIKKDGPLYRHVQSIPTLDEQLFPKILQRTKNLLAGHHFFYMFQLSHCNPQIAQDLACYALKHADSLYNHDLEEIKQEIFAKNNDEFSLWFNAQLQHANLNPIMAQGTSPTSNKDHHSFFNSGGEQSLTTLANTWETRNDL